ncbi:DUF4269 domain-containing protein [Paenibacillus maysiensis]|uniref:DUF4269 domain-containing protein n=1 Tax=Paenibacillus maysiensis TaxID=1155954 RepID=UPI00046E69F6|nr:DUF4269 domain-containing protein [Paenibacillus maysiensis]
MFKTISYLESGSEIQRRSYHVIKELNILKDFAKYTPVLCGTIPISVDIEGSDLDIIMEVREFGVYKDEIESLYGDLDGFGLTEVTVKGIPTVISNFRYGGFDLELFAQPVAVEKQNAYRHMIIEHHLLLTNLHVRQEIIRLKDRGLKTEPAFAQVFELVGDPYDELLILGTKLGII